MEGKWFKVTVLKLFSSCKYVISFIMIKVILAWEDFLIRSQDTFAHCFFPLLLNKELVVGLKGKVHIMEIEAFFVVNISNIKS